jgi:ankyrin repeat protein
LISHPNNLRVQARFRGKSDKDLKKIKWVKLMQSVQIDALMSLEQSSEQTGRNSFHQAAKSGNVRILEYLIMILNKRNKIYRMQQKGQKRWKRYGFTADGQLPPCKSFQEVIDFQDLNGMTPLMLACQVGNTDVARVFVENGANIYFSCFRQMKNALHYAI